MNVPTLGQYNDSYRKMYGTYMGNHDEIVAKGYNVSESPEFS